MKISLNWLKQYVDIDVPVAELCDRMIMSGFEVESIEDLAATMDNVVVGRIVKLEKHPDADRLQICQINVGGEEPVQIVTGADNIFEGALVPTALHDSHLPNGMHIKRGKLRGVASNGMLCSGEELCLKESDYPGAEVHGILILRGDDAPGTDLRAVLKLDDVVIDFKITANRPDCQSVIGVAREAAVALGKPCRLPAPAYPTAGGDIHEHIAVTVEDTDLCPRYMGRVVRNLRIAPSPEWMQLCLKAAGMRPINNIVDITNFVMLETGQPMHAFDLSQVRGARIIVRRAAAGESITTLDGRPHPLTPEMLVIADGESPACLAGIMGGLESEITEETHDLFLEAAKFRRDSVRKTARALGIRTESSARFEKGVDIGGVGYAMDRALQLIAELDAGDIVDGVIDCCEELPEARVLTVSAARINALLGLEIPAQTMAEILDSLQIATTREGDRLICRIPSFRDDVEGCADLAEEVMRIYGYDHIVATPIHGAVTRGRRLPQRRCDDRAKEQLIADGLRETVTYSIISSKAVDTLLLPADDPRRAAVALLNPLGEEYAVLRTQLYASMLTVLGTNYSRKIPAVRFFELSKCFYPKALPVTEQPDEVPALALGLYGRDEDFYTLKGVLEGLFAAFGVTAGYTPSQEPFLHPGRQAAAACGKRQLAVFGEALPDVAASYGLDTRAYLAQVDLTALYACANRRIVYQPLPRYPAVERDVALLCDAATPAAEIERTIRAGAGRYLEDITLFDVYQGAQIAAGKKSVAYSLRFRSPDGTLTDAQVDEALHTVFENLKEKGCILRS